MITDKRTLRAHVAEKAAALTEEYVSHADMGIFSRLVSLPEYKNARNIFAYLSVGREPDTRRFIEAALADGKRVYLPISLPGGIMVPARITALSQLVPGRFGIPAPPEDAQKAEAEDLDFVLVPAVCYDRGGFRLGRGGGYYDRYLARASAFAVGVGYSALVMDRVPRQEYDMPVNCLVTETETLRY